MERTEWLKQMREMAEALYDHISPEYWVNFGLYANETHREYLQKFLERVPAHSILLSAACGAGRYDGMVLEAGHSVVGIDQSAGMLARAKEHFPQARYEKMGLQEMDFHEAFDGAICMDALEHVCPEDWPGTMKGFQESLSSSGAPGDLTDLAVYHYYPSLEQVRAWIGDAGLVIEEQGTGNGYEHFVVRKR